MRLQVRASGRGWAGFTMVEIAIAIAVIGFALVAIVGVLPTGLNVQRDNREDTIINQDGSYWMEAIRNGATGSVDLAGFVLEVTDRDNVLRTNLSAETIIGYLSAPPALTNPVAKVRAITSSAAERDAQTIGFEYYLLSNIRAASGASNLYEIQLTFRWPVLQSGGHGNGRKVLRTLVSGRLVETNNLFHFEPGIFNP